MNRGGLFKFGASKQQFLDKVSRSPLLQSAWTFQSGASINSPSTLPLEIKTKEEIYDEVAKVNSAGSRVGQVRSKNLPLNVKTRQGIAYAKELLKFYRHGVSVVWKNNKEARKLMQKTYKLSGFLNNHGKEVDIRIPNFHTLTKQLAQHIYINLMENKSQMDATRADVVRVGQPDVPSSSRELISMTRAEFQLVKRTPGDFIKIPLFAVVVTIFMEMTPVLCYAIPELTPSTCILPSILPRIWRPEYMKKLEKSISLSNIESVDDYAMKTAYSLPQEQLYLLCSCLRLKSRYVPTALYPDSVLRDRLQNYYNYLTVDNYYLSGLNGNGNLWALSTQELVVACLERNLISNIKELMRDLSVRSTAEKAVLLDELRIKLLRFIVDFSNSNIGYLGIGHLLDQPNTSLVRQWRA